MNAPTHLACAACIASFMAFHAAPKKHSRAWLLAGAIAAGMLSHILLDLTPHYAWIVYLDWLGSRPHSGVLRELLLGGAVGSAAIWIAARTDLRVVVAGMLGSAYLDIEKVAALGLGLSPTFVIFDWHSLQVSSQPASLSKGVLVAIECVILVASFAGLIWIRCASGCRPSAVGTESSGK
ncbi:MAG: hypothetical protein O2923_07390 [Verrucomicrobia bacterium]|nr:hypothetical protein [Verrucomicrobiota bacterium]MDA1086956.1 hypothetical protein [Verrucomicrobiota bacterium]